LGDTRGSWDQERLHQVMTNLLSNAVQHGAKNEPIRVRLGGDDSGVELSVTNIGPPIAPETLAHIFEPFRRGSDHSSKRGRGVGLGLYISERIVSAHGGSIHVSSTTEGTTFTLRLPRRAPRVGYSEPPPAL
jgi:signal transduction histidine kinase